MKANAARLAVLLASTMLGAVMFAMPVAAQDKGKDAKAPAAKKGEATQKVFYDDDRVRIVEATFKPGDAGASIARSKRVIHVVKGGTLTLIYPDGKKEPLPWKTGETKMREASPVYSPKNEGKSDIVLFVVNLKEQKK